MAERSRTRHTHTEYTPDAPIPRPARRGFGLGAVRLAIRPRLRARPVLVLALATIVAVIVGSALSRARAATNQLGTMAPVVVALHPIEAGSTLDATNTAVQNRPIGFVPAGALVATGLDQTALSRIALSQIGTGEVITEQRVAGESGIKPDEQAVLLPTVVNRQDLTAGDRVQVYGLSPIGTGDQPIGAVAVPLAEGRVLEVLDQAVSVVVNEAAVLVILETAAVGAVEVVQIAGD